MISVTFLSKSYRETLDFSLPDRKMVMDCSNIIQVARSFVIEIVFDVPITAFRNHDYTWLSVQQACLATEFSPKILQLENGYYVQANQQQGIWEIDAHNRQKLLWHFNPEFSQPITKYTGNCNAKMSVNASSVLHFQEQPALLFSKHGALELSRSALPFSAVACFTDHCDFDTLENLTVQRNFFKKHHLTTTKGFFLNHFSKRADNASVEKNREALTLWEHDGHELCYHSLSQSLKSESESWEDFRNFTPPFSGISVWIDHGYQPYNFSLFENTTFDAASYESHLVQKRIKILWNYIDSGTAATGVINQLNPIHFTLASFLNGNKSLGTVTLLQAMIKNSVFHYLNDEQTIAKYKLTAQHFKRLVYQKRLALIPVFIRDSVILFKRLFAVFYRWKSIKNTPYRLSKYTPLFFKHTILNEEFVVFQTIEMIDFEKSLSRENVDLLLAERGVFIAHTYFSDTISYHSGKLLDEKGCVAAAVEQNFNYLSSLIEEDKIWNPTLSEFYNYLKPFESVLFDVAADGTFIIKNQGNLIFRAVV